MARCCCRTDGIAITGKEMIVGEFPASMARQRGQRALFDGFGVATMELIFGMKPMSQFGALAMPMFAGFQAKPDLRPCERRMRKADISATTQKTAWGVKETSTMDLTKEDAADDLPPNEIIWRNVRGVNSPMPSPVRRAWVLSSDADGKK